MTAPGGETVTVLDAPFIVDRYGAEVRDWDNSVDVTVSGCSLQPMNATEATVDREFTLTHSILFAPYSTAILATSRVLHLGVTYEVEGEPAYWRDEMGTPDHLECTLKRLEG